jgi:hypothetical protein
VHDPRALWLQSPETGLRVTWLGHSTMLLEVHGVRIPDRPGVRRSGSPVSFMGPKRFQGMIGLADRWSEFAPHSRFALSQQAGSALRSSLTIDLESRLHRLRAIPIHCGVQRRR